MNEQQRQLDYIEKAKAYVEALTQQLGRKATCCVTTFGCQMNARDSEKDVYKRQALCWVEMRLSQSLIIPLFFLLKLLHC